MSSPRPSNRWSIYAYVYMCLFTYRTCICSHSVYSTRDTQIYRYILHFKRFFKELLCSLITGLFSMPLGVLQFIPVYHILHDNYNIHTEVCVLVLFGFFGLMVWMSDRNPSQEARSRPKGEYSVHTEQANNIIVRLIVNTVITHSNMNASCNMHSTCTCTAYMYMYKIVLQVI